MNKHLVICVLALVFSNYASAAKNVSNEIFNVMVQNTKAKAYSTSNGAVVGFGSTSIRVPQTQFTALYNLNLPSMRYGCSGIDINLGSFSMINKDAIIQQLRSIASGAATYAFGAAIDGMCNSCWSNMQKWQEDMNEYSKYLRGGCEALAAEFGDDIKNGAKSFVESMSFDTVNEETHKEGTHSDIYDAKATTDTQNAKEKCGEKCNINVFFEALKKSDYRYSKMTVGALSLEPIEVAEMFMSLVGTWTISTDSQDANSDSDATTKYAPGTLDIKTFLDGDPKKKDLYKLVCNDISSSTIAEDDKCMDVSKRKMDQFVGLKSSIYEKMKSYFDKLAENRFDGSAVTDEEYAVISAIPDAQRTVARSLRSGQASSSFIELLSEKAALDILDVMMLDFRKAFDTIIKSDSAKIPKDYIEKIEKSFAVHERDLYELRVKNNSDIATSSNLKNLLETVR
ncbi:conjugal transfer protein TraH [Pseudoalteromonas sp. T1lg23B]|uniref:conjugal transfer protein TraH n=1 Tax=Pseudoalteromonas sp. T1lg23B TaxID=2077097 RepID=UPI000CF5E374|nr:conjugal transfer protein TraH [Pseudoalteromonas sp. T1lg23B]